MGNIEISAIDSAGATLSTGVKAAGNEGKKEYEFFNTDSGDGTKPQNYKGETLIYKNETGATVWEHYVNKKLVSKEVKDKKWHGKIEWEPNGNVKVVDYHDPKNKTENGKISYRIEINSDGQYTLIIRNGREKTKDVQTGNINDESFREIRKLYIDETIDILNRK